MVGSQLLDRAILATTRCLNAPPKRVFDALTSAEMLTNWLGSPDDAVLIECASEPWAGGVFRCRWRTAAGKERTLTGSYLVVERPGRLVRDELVDFGQPAAPTRYLAVVELEARGRGTLLTWTSRLIDERLDLDAMLGGSRLGPAAVERGDIEVR